MSNVLVEEASLQNIANAIRRKNGLTTTYRPAEMPNAILAISGGGSTPDDAEKGIKRTYRNYQFISNTTTNVIKNTSDNKMGPFPNVNTFIRPADIEGNILKPDFSEPFEIFITFLYTATSSKVMALFGAEQGLYYLPCIELQAEGAGIICYFSTNGTSYTNNITFTSGATDDIVLTPNTTITILARWDGTNYTVTVNDGTNVIIKSVTPTQWHYYNENYNLEFGGVAKNADHVASNVILDLDNTYIKINDSLIWGYEGKGFSYGGALIAGGTFTKNGTYYASDKNVDGYNKITINVHDELATVLLRDNGEYTVPEGYTGIGSITVNVPETVGDIELNYVNYYNPEISSDNARITTGTIINNTIKVS